MDMMKLIHRTIEFGASLLHLLQQGRFGRKGISSHLIPKFPVFTISLIVLISLLIVVILESFFGPTFV